MLSLDPHVWVRSPHPLPHASIRLLCVPYGGEDASFFRSWSTSLPEDLQDRIEMCPIQLPGRGHRYREPLFSSLSALLDVLVPTDLARSPLFPYLDKPFALFGSGLGGLISFELARALATRHSLYALSLCIAACRAPHLSGPYEQKEEVSLGDDDLVKHLHSLGGLPASLLSDEKHLRLILPKIRADVMMATTYAYTPGAPLCMPVTVCGASEDALVSLPDIAAWQMQTTEAFRLYLLPGNHFFLKDAQADTRASMLEYLSRSVREVLSQHAEEPSRDARQEKTLLQTAHEVNSGTRKRESL